MPARCRRRAGPILVGDPASLNVTPLNKKFRGFSESADGVSESKECAREADSSGSS
jgi:hypothetical protein